MRSGAAQGPAGADSSQPHSKVSTCCMHSSCDTTLGESLVFCTHKCGVVVPEMHTARHGIPS